MHRRDGGPNRLKSRAPHADTRGDEALTAEGAAMNGVATFSAVVTEVVDLTHDVREIALRLQSPGRIDFLPGQFVSFEIARPGARFKMTRAYSIVSTPDSADEVRLLFNRVEGGPGSEYLFGLTPGQETQFRGPFGSFTLAPGGTRDLLFVATSTGIAPIWSMLWWLAAHDARRRATLIWGLRSERDIYYAAALAQLATRMPSFSHLITLSRPAGLWDGATGRVQPLVESMVSDVSRLEVYICGNSAMIADVTAIVKQRGLCPIHREQYYRA
jgi:CDP-4-dehydro-6-deoxyglucose reductase